jgi:hypothetical protein
VERELLSRRNELAALPLLSEVSAAEFLKKPIYPKILLVESLKPLLPDEIVFRKK